MSSYDGRSDPASDPFGERLPGVVRFEQVLLGARFEFSSRSPRLLQLVKWAYSGLPRHRLPTRGPRIRIELVLASRQGTARSLAADPPPLQLYSGAGLLGAGVQASSFVCVAPNALAALVVVSPELLSSPYQVRYELIELAVFTLASRAQGLTPLHAACVGRNGRGLLLVGDSGAGKSTLTCHCLLNGFQLVAEDSVFVQPKTLLATGAANFLHLRDESLRFLPRREQSQVKRSPVIRRRSGVEKHEVDARRLRGRVARAPVRLAAVIFASSSRSGRGPTLRPLRRREFLAKLAATQPYGAGRPEWPAFRRSLSRVPAFELSRGEHPAEAVALLRELLYELRPNTSRYRPA